MDTKLDAKADFLFEVSSEVCNKVGGIYTVVVSKVELMQKYYPNYFLVGPYYKDKADIEFKEEAAPEYLLKAFEQVRSKGIICHYGKWMVAGNPKVILVDYFEFQNQHKNDVKKELWEWYQIETHSINDFETLLMWSSAVGRVLEEVEKQINQQSPQGKKLVGHFHEFLAGPAMLYLRHQKSNFKTVFTTHATILGRAIAGTGGDLYKVLDSVNPYEEAKKYGIIDKFTTEKACAHTCHVFTTVSEITGLEAEKLLGRKPDVLVLNGLDIDKFPTFEETSINHRSYRDKIREFISYFFFPHYTFDLEETIVFFIVGRYEYRNKGLDIMTKALGRLNAQLKKDGSKKTVVALYWIPNGTYGIRKELLENKDFYRHIKHVLESHLDKIQNNIISDIISGVDMNNVKLFTQEFSVELKKQVVHFKKGEQPLFSTHYIDCEENDSVVKGFKDNGLMNTKADRVKVINYPVYLNGADGLIDLSYYDGIMGTHLGIFPSYYEPWGYTPLETAALGVPSITTDLAGFGRFIEKANVDGGIYVLKRLDRNEEDVVTDFTNILYKYTNNHQKDRVSQKLIAKKLSELADWKELIKNYITAHNLAVER